MNHNHLASHPPKQQGGEYVKPLTNGVFRKLSLQIKVRRQPVAPTPHNLVSAAHFSDATPPPISIISEGKKTRRVGIPSLEEAPESDRSPETSGSPPEIDLLNSWGFPWNGIGRRGGEDDERICGLHDRKSGRGGEVGQGRC